MLECIAVLSSGLENINLIKAKIQGVRDDAPHRFVSTFFNKRKSELCYYNMACDHVTDIVTKLELRFITGTSDPEPRGYRNKGVYIYEDEGIF